jgi:hypothetical protein
MSRSIARPCDTPIARAVASLISAAFPQVIFVMGSGSSCSQALFAKRPS